MKIGETVEKEIQRRQLIWYGHAKRKEGKQYQEWLCSTSRFVKRKKKDQER